MASLATRVDDLQRRRPVVGYPLAVIYKFSDDQGPYLAAVLTHYAFVAIFPLLLIGSSVLGFLLRGNLTLRDALLTSALGQFPIVGTQLAAPEGLQGSTGAVVVGALAASYGVIGLGQAVLHVVLVVWAIPRNSRPNPIWSRLRSALLLLSSGVTVLVLAALTVVGSNIALFGAGVDAGLAALVNISSLVLTVLVITAIIRVTSPSGLSWRHALRGALFIAVMLRLLRVLGGVYVKHVVSRATDVNGVFALTLGLIALIFLASLIVVYGLELSVVASRHLYPRALLTPFTDAVSLTEADERAYTSYARAQRHKGFEEVTVTFDNDRDQTTEPDG